MISGKHQVLKFFPYKDNVGVWPCLARALGVCLLSLQWVICPGTQPTPASVHSQASVNWRPRAQHQSLTPFPTSAAITLFIETQNVAGAGWRGPMGEKGRHM